MMMIGVTKWDVRNVHPNDLEKYLNEGAADGFQVYSLLPFATEREVMVSIVSYKNSNSFAGRTSKGHANE